MKREAICHKCGRPVSINQLAKNMEGREMLNFHYIDSQRTAECPGSRKPVEAHTLRATIRKFCIGR